MFGKMSAKVQIPKSGNNGSSHTSIAVSSKQMWYWDHLLAVLPLLPSAYVLWIIQDNVIQIKICMSVVISVLGFLATSRLITIVAEYTLRKGLSGKDMGKKGSSSESKDIPEALGIVSGTVFLICTIVSQLTFARTAQELVIYNSALFSICFMIFLGFTDDTLDLKWRYKLILPSVASLPLLSTYSGNTAVYIPAQLRFLLVQAADPRQLTLLGALIDKVVTVDMAAQGAIVELGYVFLIFMGLLAVFCTNAINILAGINGLECGQSYIIACGILFFKLYDIGVLRAQQGWGSEHDSDDALFAIFMILPFIATSLALLRYNWFPASVFVGDTFCYFAGMTFAVVGIHGHFSKTLIMLFLPQIFNFVYSVPQLFHFVPCPRHRLPRYDPVTRLMYASTFPCKSTQYGLFKRAAGDIECPNFTIICAVLRIAGPMRERTLTIVLLCIQTVSVALAFVIRYVLLAESI